MDIISLIFIFILSQHIPILHDILIVPVAFGVLVLAWISLVVIFTLAIAISGVLYLPKLYSITCRLGMYHTREYESEKLKEVFIANFVIGISLFLVLIYIFNSVPSSFFVNENNGTNNLNTSATHPNSLTFIPSNGAFTSALMLVPTFLLTLRLLANPTMDWIKNIIDCKNLSDSEIQNKVRCFKDQVISFYYSFIAGTIVLFLLSMFLTAYLDNSAIDVRLLTPFVPKMDIFSIIFFISLEFLIVTITTLLGEWYLKISSPIDQI